MSARAAVLELLRENARYDVEDIARQTGIDQADVAALRGWRYDVFGAHALALKHGRIALAARGKRVAIVDLDGSERTAE